jgi:hypothetical protein
MPGCDFIMAGFKSDSSLGGKLAIPFILCVNLFFATWRQDDLGITCRRFARATAWECIIVGGIGMLVFLGGLWVRKIKIEDFYTLMWMWFWAPLFLGIVLVFALKKNEGKVE